MDEVREGLIIGFLHHLTATVAGFCNGSDVPKFPPTLLLLLSKMCIEYKESNVRHLVIRKKILKKFNCNMHRNNK